MRQKPSLTAADTETIMEACRAEASRNGWAVSIAIVDEGGYLMRFERLDGAGLLTAETAIAKARTAALSRGSSKALEDRVMQRLSFLNLPQYVPVQGGLPIKIDADCVGGIGVSGVQSENDERIAAAGLSTITPQP
jgi:glc operon protein GlcG